MAFEVLILLHHLLSHIKCSLSYAHKHMTEYTNIYLQTFCCHCLRRCFHCSRCRRHRRHWRPFSPWHLRRTRWLLFSVSIVSVNVDNKCTLLLKPILFVVSQFSNRKSQPTHNPISIQHIQCVCIV